MIRSADFARYDYMQLRLQLLLAITRYRQVQLSVACTVAGKHYIKFARGVPGVDIVHN
jgi:hypothetical protein